MRLRITEMLDAHYERTGDSMTMRELARRVYSEKDTIDQTNYNRLSALNTGNKEATVRELAALMRILDCDCADLIED